MMLMLPYAGPKMYLGQCSISKDFTQSSTKLHMDITDAYNEMLYAAKCPDGSPGFAIWDIWDATDTFLLRKCLREKCGWQNAEDIIHSQSIYVTPDLIEYGYKKYGIRPYTFHQYPGDIVLIPAHSPHQVRHLIIHAPSAADAPIQVSNCADAIKVAFDFVSMDNLKRTERVACELRRQRLAASYGDDVLAFYWTLWYTWEALSCEQTATIGGDVELTPAFVPVGKPLPVDIDVDPSPTDVDMTSGDSPLSSTSLNDPPLVAAPVVTTVSMQKANRDRVYRKLKREERALANGCRPGFHFSLSV